MKAAGHSLGAEQRIGFLSGAFLLVTLTATGLMFTPVSPFARVVASVLSVMSLIAFPMMVIRLNRFRIRTLTNVIAAIRESDYTSRVLVRAGDEDAISLAARELNGLAESLYRNRLEQLEVTALLRAIVEGIDAAVFAFDSDDRLKLVNPYGTRLTGVAQEGLIGRNSREIMDGVLTSGPDIISVRGEKWQIRRSAFREEGKTHKLIVATDLSRALREEERTAWQRLLRVITHELNNSVAPIRSLTQSARTMLQNEELPSDWKDDLSRALDVISSRTDALSRFTQSYADLTQLPVPRLTRVSIRRLVERVVGLEQRLRVGFQGDDDVTILADETQLEQMLINLVKNAVDAALETRGSVEVTWQKNESAAEIRIVDDGPGVDGMSNLFVPFFTTKPGGNGVGLVLSRQIAEAHHGTLTLEPRTDRTGACVVVRLPQGMPSFVR